MRRRSILGNGGAASHSPVPCFDFLFPQPPGLLLLFPANLAGRKYETTSIDNMMVVTVTVVGGVVNSEGGG